MAAKRCAVGVAGVCCSALPVDVEVGSKKVRSCCQMAHFRLDGASEGRKWRIYVALKRDQRGFAGGEDTAISCGPHEVQQSLPASKDINSSHIRCKITPWHHHVGIRWVLDPYIN